MPVTMTGENIICFAKEWTEDPTSNNHVMQLLARNNRVVWLNSIAMRQPDFTSGRDLGKILRKLGRFVRGPQLVAANLWVVTPIVLPFPHNRLAVAINRWILRTTVGLLRRRLGMREFQLWTFLPTAVEYVGKLGESMVVYYCIDEWSNFPRLDGPKMVALERALLEKADVCFATAHTLFEAKRLRNANTVLALHGVDHDHFAKALAADTAVAGDIAGLPRPIIGFFGGIHEWIDLELIAAIARAHPQWSVVLIGKASVDVSALRSLPNVHLPGRRPYERLPEYCKGFDVAIIPFVVNDLTRHVNPIKLREYLSAGLPVVSTALPEVEFYEGLVYVARNHKEFIGKIEQAVSEDSRARRQQRSETMRGETWDNRVAEIGEQLMRVKAAKARPRPG